MMYSCSGSWGSDSVGEMWCEANRSRTVRVERRFFATEPKSSWDAVLDAVIVVSRRETPLTAR